VLSVYKSFCKLQFFVSPFVSACSAVVLCIPINFEWDFGSVNISETKGLLYEESFGNVLYIYYIMKL
jgi:hypothetical protein